MKIPALDFMMPGFPRCGTTTITHLLSEHPGIFITTPKEPGFFKPKNYQKRQSWRDYAQLFDGADPQAKQGEGTVTYTTSWPPELADPKEVYRHYPKLKLIFLMRDPVERIVSQWINKTQQNYPKDIPVFGRCTTHYSIFLNTSRYWNHITRWLEYFDDEQVLAICLEQFKENPRQLIQMLEDFLDVRRYEYDFQTRLNASNVARRDSNFERYIKRNEFAYKAAQLAKQVLPLDWVHKLLKSDQTVQWDEDTLRWVRKEPDSDSRAALEYADLNPSYWPKMFPDESERS
ncbi:sulfotransferase family protein [Salinibacter ruber]|jgi:hypothetical protein|uniref:Sulfotransferase domain-containing protein n=1 Tax=Salinibacter ruber TaxID=146919 RepID=A0AAW5PB87_9BACT|nr:sulfotransferase [Salinibacter ruber]MCS4159172.1 hypothetical protein [Salinibacter ruber]MCS4223283.1 hypothetical protein [Salinibacter ruber]